MPEPISFSSVSLDAARMSTPSSGNREPDRLKEACSEMESLFIYYLLKEMRATVPKSGFLGGGKAEQMYTSMLDLELAKEIASNREIGISSKLLDQFGSNIDTNNERNDEKKEESEIDSR